MGTTTISGGDHDHDHDHDHHDHDHHDHDRDHDKGGRDQGDDKNGRIYGDGSVSGSGHDTIHFGHGNDSQIEAGHATVVGAFGGASIHIHSQHPSSDGFAASGAATLVGGEHSSKFIAGHGADTLIGGSSHSTMAGGGGSLFSFSVNDKVGTDVIKNFVSGHDKLYLEGQSLSYLQSHGDITVSHGNTYISLDHGHTTVELKGFTHLTSSDVTTHKG